MDKINGVDCVRIDGTPPYLNRNILISQRPGTTEPSYIYAGDVTTEEELIVYQKFDSVSSYNSAVNALKASIGDIITIQQADIPYDNLRLHSVTPIPERLTIGLNIGVLGAGTVLGAIRIKVSKAQ